MMRDMTHEYKPGYKQLKIILNTVHRGKYVGLLQITKSTFIQCRKNIAKLETKATYQ